MGEHKAGLKRPWNAPVEDWHYGPNTVRGLCQDEERQGKGGGMHQDLRAEKGRLEIGVESAYDRGLFCVAQSAVCVPLG